jgi:aminobenzoyl-glutamate transport protein
MLGVGIAEKSGLISAALKKTVLSAPDKYITAVVIFAAKGRHPIVGLAAAFADVSGGFSANLLISTLDPLLAGLSQEAAQLIDPNYTIPPTVNYYQSDQGEYYSIKIIKNT